MAEQKRELEDLDLVTLKPENLKRLDASKNTITVDMARDFLTSLIDDLDSRGRKRVSFVHHQFSPIGQNAYV